ncbi:hypothetical protein [Trujillonella endophytica]|uniref:Uncharacterized protein n=1 Tax=Trujillonella endophytica TaxID=673521 RepID=A0A1H8UHZ4_9ACTN|nr:hypothetical protein [Trujillella endophytica]SEP02862.1 hypothetical protein SAMN05660991_02937 [Trujillella endophytica]
MDATMNATLRARAYADLGIELPAEAARVLGIIRAVNEAALADPMAGVDLDKLTAANAPKVLREAALTRAVKAGTQEIAGGVSNQLGRRVNVAFAEDHDRLVEELRPRFLEAAAVVTDALAAGLTAEVYGDGAQVLKTGPAAASLYHRTRDALAFLAEIRSFLRSGRANGFDVATIVTLTGQAHGGTLDIAQQIVSGTGGNERLLQLYAVPGIAPALNDAEQALDVVARAAERQQATADAEKAAALEAGRADREAWARMVGLASR